MGKEVTYFSLQGFISIPGDIDHQRFITEFYELLESKGEGWFFQGKSKKLFDKEDLDGREKRDSH
jgi:hypothetical protein